MNASTRQRIGMVLFACTALLAGCSRKADEGATAVQPPQGVLLAYVWDCDDGTSLTESYADRMPFRFNGAIDRVTIDLR